MDDGKPTPPLAPDTALDWPGRSATGADVLAAIDRRMRQRRRARRRTGGAVAAGMLLATVGVVWQRPATPPAAPAAAVAPAPTRQILADGSEVELNGGAAVRVEFGPAVRRVVIERGEAHFDVRSDPSRPFVVVAGEVAVRAVGTAFAVQFAPSGVDVLVTEGRVAVDRAAAPAVPETVPTAPLAFVAAGARVTVAPADLAPAAAAPVVTSVTAAEMAARLAWRVPRLDFNDTPLREAVALFNRHGRVRLALAEPALGELRVSGTVRADNVAALLDLLRADYGVISDRRGDREIVLLRR
jgi:transmembrane sensor